MKRKRLLYKTIERVRSHLLESGTDQTSPNAGGEFEGNDGSM
jgi:hypothetical protein